MMRLRDRPRITFGFSRVTVVLELLKGATARIQPAEQDTKQLVARLEVAEMRLRGETKVGDSGVADVWRYDRVKGVEIEGRANMKLSDDKC